MEEKEIPKNPRGTAINPNVPIVITPEEFTFLQNVKAEMEQFIFPFNLLIKRVQNIEQRFLEEGNLVHVFKEDLEPIVDNEGKVVINPLTNEPRETLKKDYWENKK